MSDFYNVRLNITEVFIIQPVSVQVIRQVLNQFIERINILISLRFILLERNPLGFLSYPYTTHISICHPFTEKSCLNNVTAQPILGLAKPG